MKSIKILLVVTAIVCAQTISFAQAWTPTSAPNLFWMAIASSADGTKLAAVEGGVQTGPICTSTNSGTTWITNNAPYLYWNSIASSADGNKLAACVYGGGIYTSTNCGTDWVSNSVPYTNWSCIASSADGNTLAAAVDGDGIYFSTNGGTAWKLSDAPVTGWRAIASSADGTKMVAGVNGGGIYLSTNFGANWTLATNAPDEVWTSISSSAKGDKLAATTPASPSESVFISTNSGATWIPVTNFFAESVASSADGNTLVCAASADGIYTSTNSGMTWVLSGPGNGLNWQIVASSADGARLFAGWGDVIQAGGGISALQTTPAPKMNIHSQSNSVKLSWTVPSAAFVLQQSPTLTSMGWTAVTNVPTLNLTNLQDEVIFPQTNSSFFYRLKTP